MGLFRSWKSHLELVESNFKFVDSFQNQKIEAQISTKKSAEPDIAGTFVVTVKNSGNMAIHDLYCHMNVPKGYALFYKEMFLGSESKHWKINILNPGDSVIQQFDFKLRKTKWMVIANLEIYSPSSRHGHQEMTESIEFELTARKVK